MPCSVIDSAPLDGLFRLMGKAQNGVPALGFLWCHLILTLLKKEEAIHEATLNRRLLCCLLFSAVATGSVVRLDSAFGSGQKTLDDRFLGK